MSWSAWFASILFLAPLSAQPNGPEDRPKLLLPDTPLTREQLDQQRADIKVRQAQTLYGMGLIQRRSDRLLEAMRAFEEAVQLDANALSPRRALVPIYLTLSRDEDAERLCREIVARDPGDYETWLILAGRQKDLNQPNDAIESLRRSLKSVRLKDHPERQILLQRELAVMLERHEHFLEAEVALLELAVFLEKHRDKLITETKLKTPDIDQIIAQCYERAGKLAVRLRRFNEALEAFRKSQNYFAKLTDPVEASQAARINWNLAEVFIAQEQWADALKYLDRYLERGAPQLEAFERKVLVLKRLQREDEIVPSLQREVDRDRNHVGLQLMLARELGKRPQSQAQAESMYTSLIRTYTTTEVYRGLFQFYQQQNRPEEVINLLDKTFKIANRKDGEGPLTEREDAIERGRIMIAAIQLEPVLIVEMLKIASNDLRLDRERNFDTFRVLGVLAARAKQLDTAEALLQRGLVNAHPQMVMTIHEQLIPILWQRHKYQEIIRIGRDGLALQARLGGVGAYFHYHLAMAYASIGQFDQALKHADEGVKLSSDRFRISNRVRKATILAWAGKHREAITEAETLLKDSILPNEIREARYALARVHVMARNFAKSEDQLRLLLELDPSDATANNDLGYEMADQGRNLDEAEKLVRKAVELDRAQRKSDPDADSDNAAYLDSLGWVLFRRGQFAEARQWLEQASVLPDGTEDPTVWDHLGDVYWQLKEPAKARQSWDKALQFYQRDRFRPTYEDRANEVRKKVQQLTNR